MLRRWIKFNFVGAMGVVVQITLLALLTKVLGVHYLLATFIAVESALLHNFLWHQRFTWREREGSTLQRLVGFHLGNGAVSLIGNLVLMRIFVGSMGLPTLPANLLSIASCGLVNFLISDRIVFRSPREC
jgi:putative flippase GtrA